MSLFVLGVDVVGGGSVCSLLWGGQFVRMMLNKQVSFNPT